MLMRLYEQTQKVLKLGLARHISELFTFYKEAFSIHSGQRNPLQSPEDELYDSLSFRRISEKLIPNQNKLLLTLTRSNFL